MSRGVSEQEARKLVVKGFLLEVIQQIGDDSLEEELRSAIESQLDRSEGASS
jgi:Fe-S cluster assembly protein SufD